MPDFTYSTSTPNAQLSEEQRRRRLVEKLAREYSGPIDEQTRRQLENKARTIPLQQVDQELGYQPDARVAQRQESLNAGQAGVEEAQARLAQRQQAGVDQPTPLQQQLFNLIDQKSSGQIGFAQYAQKWEALTGQQLPGATKAIENQRRQEEKAHAEQLKQRYGRQVGNEYLKSLQRARESGLYDEDFKDNLFGAGAFNGTRAASRRGWTKEDYANEYKMLNGKVDDFERVRQQLTENFQRMDPFARTQYNEMSKQIQGLENARANGQVRPVEYLRAMGQLADRSQQIKWKYHMRQPGQSPGEISENNGFIQRMTPEGPEIIGLSDAYVAKNTRSLPNGKLTYPKWTKNGIEQVESDDVNADRIPDVLQRSQIANEINEKVSKQYMENKKAWLANPLNQMQGEPTAEQEHKFYADAEAHVINMYKRGSRAVDAILGDPEASQELQQGQEAARQAAGQQEQQIDQQRAQQEVQMQKAQQQQQEQAVSEAAAQQLMEKYGMDEATAIRVAKDDMYATQNANPASVLKRRSQYDREAKRAERGIGPEELLVHQSLIKNAKNAEEIEKIKSENWERDPILSEAADNPIVYGPGMKKRVGEVYLMRRGNEYLRVWHLGENKNIILRTPEERLQERLQRIEENKRKETEKGKEARKKARQAWTQSRYGATF